MLTTTTSTSTRSMPTGKPHRAPLPGVREGDLRSPFDIALAAGRLNPTFRASKDMHFGGCAMKFAVNVSKPVRLLYIVAGLALVAVPFAFDLEGWVRVVMPILGVGTVAEGASGW